MPEQYGPKTKPYPLSNAIDGVRLVRVSCRYCKRLHNYRPEELIQIFGDVDIDSLAHRMRCENGDHGYLEITLFSPTGSQAVGLRIRRLVAIRIRREPLWRDE